MTTTPSSLVEAARALERRAISSLELTDACLDRIARRDGDLHAFITVMADSARAAARRADDEIAAGGYRGALHGIPVAIKDLVDVAGTRTTSASAVTSRLAATDAPVVANLRRAGSVIVGKTNLHEFAFGTTSDETAFGAVRHPLDPSLSAGGSSSGSAVAVLERMCFGALGTDTGGSIRIPAAVCGITGLKPTYGEVPSGDVVPLSTTLDHVGPMASSVADCRLLLTAMRDGRSVPASALVDPPAQPAALSVPGGYFFEKLDDDVRALFTEARGKLQAAGHAIRDIDIPLARHTADVYLHIVLPDSAYYHAPMLAREAHAYSPGVRLRIEMGSYVLAEDYLRALHAREVLRERVDRALDGADALMLPALPIGAPPLGAASVRVGRSQEPVRAIMLRLTQLFNITGHPAIALPCGIGHDGLPRSLQLVGRRGETDRLLDLAAIVERQMTGGAGSVGGGTG